MCNCTHMQLLVIINSMIENHQIPPQLKSQLGDERISFFVKAAKEKSTKDSWSAIRWGLLWVAVIGGIFTAMVYELLLGKPTGLNIGDTRITVTPDDLSPLYGFFTFGAFFVLPGFIVIGLGIYGFYRKGGYFLGTENRLIHLNSWKECSVYNWSEFQNKIDIYFTKNRGNLVFSLKEKIITKKNGKKVKETESIGMAEINHAREIKAFCHEKITNTNKSKRCTSP